MPQRTRPTSRIPEPGDRRTVAPNFISEIIEDDLRSRRVDTVVTRFPPEPNGYLHVGHVKAICIDFGLADDYGGATNLRFDDTNPTTENVEYVEAIKRDVRWLGFEWEELRHASDYFEPLYRYAVQLIRDGKAYVDSLGEAEIREYRGTVTEPGRPSPFRDRSVEENLDLFARMREGEFPEGAHVLRARIDMGSTNMLMRDPLLYRIRHAHHYRTGDEWHVYPMYDFAHPLSDAIEGVTHSLCTLEFDNNRELYDWVLENTVGNPRPHQYEFARMKLSYSWLSKRHLIELVRDRHVDGWDDPRMLTIAGLRRRGVRPEALRDLVNRVGVTKANSVTDYGLLEHSIRDDLNAVSPRVLAVHDPLPVTITNWQGQEPEALDASYWPHDVPREGSRRLPFAGRLFIERDDFSEDPPKGWRRLAPGREVRLRHAYLVRCDEVVKDEEGRVVELRCSYDPGSLGRNPEGRKVAGTIHWLAADHALPAEFRLYERLYRVPEPQDAEVPLEELLNPESLVVRNGFVEPSVAHDPADTRYQFERLGYFWRDPNDSRSDRLVFNRIVTLKDSWAKQQVADREPRRANGRPAEKRGAAAPQATGDGTAGAGPSDAPAPSGNGAGVGGGASTGLSGEERRRFERVRDRSGVDEQVALAIARDASLTEFFDGTVGLLKEPVLVANWLANEVRSELKGRRPDETGLTPENFAAFLRLIAAGEVSARAGKEVLARLIASGGEPGPMVEEMGLSQLNDAGAIEAAVREVIAANPDKVAAYRGGKSGLSSFFVGQVMRTTGGKANPVMVRDAVERLLAE